MANAKNFFSKAEDQRIVDAIRKAESRTSGEIRVHLEDHTPSDVLDRAVEVFAKLEMQNTDLRNGVLFYLAVQDHQFAVIGDAGINKVVEEGFWDSVRDHMRTAFAEGRFTDGLCAAIEEAGEKLIQYFPHAGANDINELPDEISKGGLD
jgi:uncharacterized membrane protein